MAFNIFKRRSKEMSRMRKPKNTFGGVFGSFRGYTLDETRVDVAMAREIYNNTHERYKLGAGFARAIINNRVAFMGTPKMFSIDERAQQRLDELDENEMSKKQQIILDHLRDGDCFVYLRDMKGETNKLFPEKKNKVDIRFLSPESTTIEKNPFTNELIKVIVTETITWSDDNGYENTATIEQHHTPGAIKNVLKSGTPPPYIDVKEEQRTGLDFIPIVHFKNEGSQSLYGQSDIEPVEPYLKIYHDVMLHAMEGSKMHSTPRLALYLKNIQEFLINNFGSTGAKQVLGGKPIDMTGRDMFILGSEDRAEFVEAGSAIGAAKDLLKTIFYNIVDASETPEFAFGVHTPSSLSSVREQMPILVRSINRKRDGMTDAWKLFARMYLYFSSQAHTETYQTYEVELKWDDIDYRSNEEISRSLLQTVQALASAVTAELMSRQAAVEYLSEMVHTMRAYETEDGDGERERIDETRMDKMRAPDNAMLESELRSLLLESGVDPDSFTRKDGEEDA